MLGTANSQNGVTLSAGTPTVKVATSATLGSTSGPVVVNVGTLDLNGMNQTVGAFSGTGGTIVNNSGAGTSNLFVTANSGTYAGVIADHGSPAGGSVASCLTPEPATG